MDHTTSVAEVVAAARAGDQRAWEAIVDRFLPLVTAVIAGFGLRGADREDVNQTVWLRLVEHLDDLRDPRALPGWVATTARNECLAHLRRSGRTRSVDPMRPESLDVPSDPDAVDQDLLQWERHQALRDGLRELPEDRRKLLMVLLEDPPPSYEQVSRRLSIPVGSIGPTRARALEQLRGTRALRLLLAAEQGDERHGALG